MKLTFLDNSYGFRPGRSCHQAVNALNKAVMYRPTNYVVEVDIKKFFDNVQHKWLMRCLRERITDPNILWLVKRFLKAGIVESGHYEATELGTPQGGIATPPTMLQGTFKEVCQTEFLIQLNFQSTRKKDIKLRHS